MLRQPRYSLVFAPETINHLEVIERKYHRLIQKAIDEQLSYTPQKETRNRRPLDRPAEMGATWELRCGPQNRFRIFYEVDTSESAIWILAIGVKEGNRLLVGGEEVEL